MADEWSDAPADTTETSPTAAQTTVGELPRLIFAYALDPIGVVRRPLLLTWRAALTLQVGAAILSGILGALVEKNWIDLVVGIFVLPILTLMIGSVFTLFIYYFFIAFEGTYLEMRRLYSITVLSTFPYFVLHAFSSFLPPLDLMGFALTNILLIVGLCESFPVNRALVIKLQIGVFLVFCAVWTVVQILITQN